MTSPSPEPHPPDAGRRWLGELADESQAKLVEEHQARETAFSASRQIIRNSANAIRATHRGEFDQANALMDQVAGLVAEVERVRESHPRVYYSGFVEDSLKEYAEAKATLAFVQGVVPPGPDDLSMGSAPYLNGVAEAVGELRRFILDSLRRDDFTRTDELLGIMDDVYTVLVSMDFPEAVTGGLRRRTDSARGILERTRGDVTLAVRQRSLEERLLQFERSVGNDPTAASPPDGP